MANHQPAARLAEEWGDRLLTIARNLTEFNESEAARRVLSRLGDKAYDGRTLAEAAGAAGALQSLWQDYLVLSSVVEKADALSRRVGFLSNRDEAVAALLQGQSVKLPMVSVPVGRRNLLDPADHAATATPNDVLMSMTVAFAMARDAIADVARAEDQIGARLAAIRARSDALEAWRSRTRIETASQVAPLLGDAERDPLTASDALASIERTLTVAEVEQAKADLHLARLETNFAQAQAALEHLRVFDREVADARTEAAACIEGAAPAGPATDDTAVLADWLATLRRTAAEGHLAAASVGLARYDGAVTQGMAHAKTALFQARAPVAELGDLRGRFRALRVKGAVVRSGTAARLETETKAELARMPTRLDAARELVAAYEKALLRPMPCEGKTP